MNLFKTVSRKPWAPDQMVQDNKFQGAAFKASSTTLGFRLFLIVASVLFLLFYVAFSGRIVFPDWRALPEPSLLWVNSIILLFCSAVLIGAQKAAAADRTKPLKNYLLLAGILSILFLIGQLYVWKQLLDLGYYASLNPVNGFFYMLTGIHGIHLLGGLIAWLRTTVKVFRGAKSPALAQTTRLLAHYWHFLTLIWLIIFLSVPQYLTLLPEGG